MGSKTDASADAAALAAESNLERGRGKEDNKHTITIAVTGLSEPCAVSFPIPPDTAFLMADIQQQAVAGDKKYIDLYARLWLEAVSEAAGVIYG